MLTAEQSANLQQYCISKLSGYSPVSYATHLDLGIKLHDWQIDVLSHRSGNIVINGARQAGKSTIVSIPPVYKAKYSPNSLSIVIAPTLVQAGEDMEKIKSIIAKDYYYPKIDRSNDSEIRLSNGSRIVVAPATDAARGKSAPALVILDEASRIDDFVYQEVVLPMFTKSVNPLFLVISTPNGKHGFFYKDFMGQQFIKYEVKSPYTVDPNNQCNLIPCINEQLYKADRAKQGIKAYYSPNHRNLLQQQAFLEQMGKSQYLQEFCCEFIEPDDQVFRYSDIDAMFTAPTKSDDIDTDPILQQVAPAQFFDQYGTML